MQVHLFGRDGDARILMPEFRKEDSVRVFTEIAGQQVDIAPRVPSTPWGDDYVLEIRHFVDCIRDGTETLAPGEQGVRLMRIVDALYRPPRAAARYCSVRSRTHRRRRNLGTARRATLRL